MALLALSAFAFLLSTGSDALFLTSSTVVGFAVAVGVDTDVVEVDSGLLFLGAISDETATRGSDSMTV
jgi:hypothetical protein